MAFTSNPIYVLMILCLMVVLAIHAGKTKIGRQFGAALLVIVFTAVAANLSIIPSASNSIGLYDAIFSYVAPISIFYLLLDVNLTSIKQAGLPMIVLFLIGSLATTIGIISSWYLVNPETVLGGDGVVIAGMLTGTYTGGSVNFNAIGLEYDFQDKGILYAGTIAVDNVVTTLWIIVTLSIPLLMNRIWKGKKIDTTPNPISSVEVNEISGMRLESLAWLLFIGLAAYYISDLISVYLTHIPSILILSTIGIVLAQTSYVARLKGSQDLGLYLVFLFLAVIGAYCELSAVAKLDQVGLTLLLFAGLAVFIHGLLTIVVGGLLYRDWEMIAIISQANIGGGTTAIALAENFDRKELILPAILVGTLGIAIGSYLGFLVIHLLS